MLKTTLVLEDQSRQQMIKICASGASCDGERPPIECQDDAEETGLNKNAVHTILTEHFYFRKICAKLVPKNLSVEQKGNRLEICQDLLRRLEIEPNFLHKVKQEMNHGCLTMIPRPNRKVRNGTRKFLLVQRKRA